MYKFLNGKLEVVENSFYFDKSKMLNRAATIFLTGKYLCNVRMLTLSTVGSTFDLFLRGMSLDDSWEEETEPELCLPLSAVGVELRLSASFSPRTLGDSFPVTDLRFPRLPFLKKKQKQIPSIDNNNYINPLLTSLIVDLTTEI